MNVRTINTRTRLSAVSLVIALVVSACGSGTSDASGNNVYEDPAEQTRFDIPDDWNLYTSDELTIAPQIPFSPAFQATPILDTVAFDGAPGRSVGNLTLNVADADFPIGAQVIRSISSVSRDDVSRNYLEELVMPAASMESVQEVLQEDFTFGDDYEGIRRFRSFIDVATEQQGAAYFISVTDPDDATIYQIAVGCSAVCFERHRTEITEVVDSWLVNTNP